MSIWYNYDVDRQKELFRTSEAKHEVKVILEFGKA
jgi:hypothetical protein